MPGEPKSTAEEGLWEEGGAKCPEPEARRAEATCHPPRAGGLGGGPHPGLLGGARALHTGDQ